MFVQLSFLENFKINFLSTGKRIRRRYGIGPKPLFEYISIANPHDLLALLPRCRSRVSSAGFPTAHGLQAVQM